MRASARRAFASAAAWAGAFCGLLLAPSALSAQTTASQYGPAFVDAGHWSVTEARRLAAAGLAPVGFDAGRRVYTQREIGGLLEHARDLLRGRADADASASVDALARRFGEEFAAPARLTRLRGSGTVSFVRHDGDMTTGWGYWYGYPNGVEVSPPEERGNLVGLSAIPAIQWRPFEDVALRLASADPPGDDAPRLGESHVAGEWRGLRGWVGRHAIGYGPGASGGIVLSDAALFDGLGLQNSRPLRLPWYLRYLGPAGFDFTLAQFDLPNSFDDVAFLATRGTIAPHERVQLGVSRAVMFGGDGNTEVDAFALFSILIGKHAGDVSELDNQVVAVDVSWRPPVERWLPLRTYVEWGFEDSAGAYANVPGVLAGIEVPVLPGLPQAGVALEYTSFARFCCGNPIWYRHSTFHDGWTRDGVPLGHPLGGHGRQWSLHASASAWGARVRASTAVFLRDRRLESLYTPDLVGESVGGVVRVAWRAAPWLELTAAQELEQGDGWEELRLDLALRTLF